MIWWKWDFSHLDNAAGFARTMKLMSNGKTTFVRWYKHLWLNWKEGFRALQLAVFTFFHGLCPWWGEFNAAYLLVKIFRNTWSFIPLHPAYTEMYEEMKEFYESEEYKKLKEERNVQ